jgi:hypothetical protein
MTSCCYRIRHLRVRARADQRLSHQIEWEGLVVDQEVAEGFLPNVKG